MTTFQYALVDVFTDRPLPGHRVGRPSTLYARVKGGPDRIDAVDVGGSAVLVGQGEYRLP